LTLSMVLAKSDAKLEVDFHNNAGVDVYLYWVSSESQVRMAEIEEGQSFRLTTFPGHIFIAKEATTLSQLGAFLMEESKTQITINPLKGEDCDDDKAKKALNDLVRKRTAAEKAEVDRENNERRRYYLNREQPPKVPKFTKTGYEVRQFPSPTWEKVIEFWNTHKNNQELERWDPGNSYVNHWEANPTMVQLPWQLKEQIFAEMKPILESWSGQELEPTSCYGVRVYKNNSILRRHVDVLQTHAISAILQIYQDVDEPWALQIMAHDGKESDVYLQPRDLVLYESAACIHGREVPLRGREYANAFIHFRPKHKWNFPADYI